MIQTFQDHADTIYPEPVADPASVAHDQFLPVSPVLANMDDNSSNSSDDFGYYPQGESDVEIVSDVSNIFPNLDHGD